MKLWYSPLLCVLSFLTFASENTVDMASGSARRVEPRKHLYYCESLKDSQHAVTLITQSSLDRLNRLYTQALAWDGSVSAALYVPESLQADEEALRRALEDVKAVHAEVEANSNTILNIALLYQDKKVTGEFYPINLLRNIAREQVKTPGMFNLDVDFIPSKGLSAHLETIDLGIKRALVIPAFGLKKSAKIQESSHNDLFAPLPRGIPRTKAEMVAIFQAKQAEAFQVSGYPRGHSPTNSQRWAQETGETPYRIQYREGYEGYVVVNKTDAPKFDERFVGYGLNKVQWVYHLNAARFKFFVEPQHFVVAAPHENSPAWKAYGGFRSSLRTRMEQAYHTFKRELRKTKRVADDI